MSQAVVLMASSVVACLVYNDKITHFRVWYLWQQEN